MRNIVILALILLLPWFASAIQEQSGVQFDFTRHLIDRSRLPLDDGQPLEWNERAYLAANPDVAAAVTAGALLSGYQHYQLYGMNEGRRGGLPETVGASPVPAPALAPSASPPSTPPATAPEPQPAVVAADPPAAPPSAAKEVREPSAAPPIEAGSRYTVRQGGTLSAVATATGTTTAELTALNPTLGLGWLGPGTVVRLPAGRAGENPVAPPRITEPMVPKAAPQAVAQKPPAIPSAAVTGIRFGQHPDRLRVVLDTTGPVTLKVTTTADGRSILIALSGTQWKTAPEWRANGASPVQSYRVVSRTDGRLLELRTRSPVTLKHVMDLPPQGGHGHRVVIDLGPKAG